MHEKEIFSNDENLKISNFKNAQQILQYNLKLKNCKSLKDCIYSLYDTVIYNAIDANYRRRILYEYCKNEKIKKYHSYVLCLNDDIKNYETFCNIITDHFDNYNELYEIYVKNRSSHFAVFKNEFYNNNYSVYTPINKVEKLSSFTYEYYYILLRDYSMNLGIDNVEDTILDFYFLLQDLYFDEKIFYKMDYKDVQNFIKDSTSYKIIIKSAYHPEDIYYCFMHNLEEKFNDKSNITELDKRSIARYNKFIEETKEEGEI